MTRFLTKVKTAFIDWWTLPATIAGVLFIDKMLVPNDAPDWVPAALYGVAMLSNVVGNIAGQSCARKDAEAIREELSAIDKALAVERERTSSLQKHVETERVLRETDRTISDGRIESLRKAHKEEEDALREMHAEEERSLRKQIELERSLKESDRTIATSRIEDLLRENGELKAEVARWKTRCMERKNETVNE
jgi:hypothetical protein